VFALWTKAKIGLIWIFLSGLNLFPSQALAKQWNEIYQQWSQRSRASWEKKLFIKRMGQCLWHENQKIARLRIQLQALYTQQKKKPLTGPQKKYLQNIFAFYKVSNWNALWDRLDRVPISLALAQGAIESGWGRARSCVRKNAFFGLRTRGRCLSFTSAQKSASCYIKTLNCHRAYTLFRKLRHQMRQKKQPLEGLKMLSGLKAYCPEANYLSRIRCTICEFQLYYFDHIAF
jgi:uncharacterized FlgJ-related protein